MALRTIRIDEHTAAELPMERRYCRQPRLRSSK